MRQHKILTWTLLLLFITNFALAAPVAVRGRPEVRIDENVPRNVSAPSQKRRDSPNDVPPPTPLTDILSQMAYADNPPPTPDSPESPVADSPSPPSPSPHHSQSGPSAPPPSPLTDILSQTAHADSSPPTPADSPGSLTGPDYVSPSSRLPVADTLSPSPHHSQPGLFTPPSSSLTDILSQTGHADNPPPTPDSPGSFKGSGYVSPSPGLPVTDSLSPPPPSPHHSHPGLPTPPLGPLTDILSQMAHTDNPLPTPDSLGSLKGSDYVSPNPGLPAPDSLSTPPSSHHSQPGPSATPPSPLTDTLLQVAHADSASPRPDRPGSLTRWEDVPSRQFWTWSRLPVVSMPAASSVSSPPEIWSPNVPGSDHTTPPNPNLADILSETAKQFAEQHGYTDSPRPPLDSIGSLTGSRLPAGLIPMPGSLLPRPLSLPHPSQPGQSEDRFPSQSGSSMEPFPLLSTGSRLPEMSEKPFPLLSTGPQFLDGSISVAGSLSPLPPPLLYHSQPGSSEDRFPSPSGSSVNPDTSSATGPTGDQPTPPHGSGMDTEMKYLLDPEPFPTEFWDKVLKGKFKRGNSGSDAVNLA